jgi:hypothetical protein
MPRVTSPTFLVSEPFLAGVIEGAMVRENQMRARAHFHPFGRDADALGHQTVGFFKEGFGIDQQPRCPGRRSCPRARFLTAADAAMKDLSPIWTEWLGVVSALITDDDVEPLGEQIDNLAFTFVAHWAPMTAMTMDLGTQILDLRSQI